MSGANSITASVLLAISLAVGVCGAASQAQSMKNASAAGRGHEMEDFRGGLVMPPLPKPRFTLTDTSGASFDFWSKTRGRVTLLFFGYTHCPDVCPMHMTFLAAALKKLPPSVSSQITVVFVTTDPDRDKPPVLRAWLDNFDKRFVGLTGTQSAIDAAQVAANVSPATRTASPGGAPQISHAAFVLAYSKDNLAHVIYPSGVSEQDWMHDLPLLASQSAR